MSIKKIIKGKKYTFTEEQEAQSFMAGFYGKAIPSNTPRFMLQPPERQKRLIKLNIKRLLERYLRLATRDDILEGLEHPSVWHSDNIRQLELIKGLETAKLYLPMKSWPYIASEADRLDGPGGVLVNED